MRLRQRRGQTGYGINTGNQGEPGEYGGRLQGTDIHYDENAYFEKVRKEGHAP